MRTEASLTATVVMLLCVACVLCIASHYDNCVILQHASSKHRFCGLAVKCAAQRRAYMVL